MRILSYLYDRKFLIAFYIILLTFISLVVYLDPGNRIGNDNILYINITSLAFFVIYLAADYTYSKRYYIELNEVIDSKKEDMINFLPEPMTYEQRLYHGLIKDIYENERTKLQRLYEDKKSNQEFVVSWVHEVKTPISVIRLILENNQDKSMEEILESIEDEVDKIEGQVEQALYYSRIDSFSRDYFINELSLDKAVRENVKRNAKAFINKRIKIDINCGEHNVLSDKKWLSFIINQILSNALKYSNVGGTIRIFSEKDSLETRLVIEDNGMGITPEDLGRVFERGFTGRTGRIQQSATGMGLYLARELALKLWHNISIESEPLRYTRVTIHFPKHNTYYDVTKM